MGIEKRLESAQNFRGYPEDGPSVQDLAGDALGAIYTLKGKLSQAEKRIAELEARAPVPKFSVGDQVRFAGRLIDFHAPSVEGLVSAIEPDFMMNIVRYIVDVGGTSWTLCEGDLSLCSSAPVVTDEVVRTFLNRRHAYSLEPGDPAWNEIKEDLTAAIAVAGTGDGWMPIESAPRDGSWFLTWDSHYGIRRGRCHVRPDHDDWLSYGDSFNGSSKGGIRATHWRPLPPAPKEG